MTGIDFGAFYTDWYDFFGIVGASLILLGFYRITIGKWTRRSVWYELDNLVGACLLMVYQIHHGTYATVVLNVIYAIVAFVGLGSYAQRRALRAQNKKARAKRRASARARA